MKPDAHDPVTAEFESRITALLLGELSPEEAADVRRAIEANPDWARLHQQLEGTIGRVRQADLVLGTDGKERRLSDERRTALLKRFRTPVTSEMPPMRRQDPRWWLPLSLAATLMLLLAIAGVLPAVSRARNRGISRGEGLGAIEQRPEAPPLAGAEKEAAFRSLTAAGPQLSERSEPPITSADRPGSSSMRRLSPKTGGHSTQLSLAVAPFDAAAGQKTEETKGRFGSVLDSGRMAGGGPATIAAGSLPPPPLTPEIPPASALAGGRIDTLERKESASQGDAEAKQVVTPVDAKSDALVYFRKENLAAEPLALPTPVPEVAAKSLGAVRSHDVGGFGGGGFGGIGGAAGFPGDAPALGQQVMADAATSAGVERRADLKVYRFDRSEVAGPKELLQGVIDSSRAKSSLELGRAFGEEVPAGARLENRPAVVSEPLAAPLGGGVANGLVDRFSVKLADRGDDKNRMERFGLSRDKDAQPELKLAEAPSEASVRQLVEAPVQLKGKLVADGKPLTASAGVEARAPVPLALSDVGLTTNRPVPAAVPIVQSEVIAAENPFSTFSLNVSDVSFKLAAASLEKGVMPESASIRSEEFINAFKYRDPEAASGVPITFAWERAQYPFAHHRDVLRLAVRTGATGRELNRPLNLVLLLDNSGSMERADRVAILREALRTLATQLQVQDRISVVTFARTARLWVDALSGSEAGTLVDRVGELNPEGGTNLEEALKLAYATAARHFVAQGVNRVVLMTDGAANLGDVDPASLKRQVETWRRRGVALDCFGIGWEGLNDDLLEELSRNGDGRYGFVNSPEEAARNFAAQLAGALHVAAADVKVQVEFYSQRVSVWRQVGYARHQLTKEQFRDNTVDAAELAASESGNSIYIVEVQSTGSGPLGTVRARFREPETGLYREHAWTVPYTGQAPSLDQSSHAIRLATTASAFSEWLAGSPYAGDIQPGRLLKFFQGVPESFDPDATPRLLETMLRQAQTLSGK